LRSIIHAISALKYMLYQIVKKVLFHVAIDHAFPALLV